MSDDRKINRRNFLGQASCAAVGTTALFSTVLDLGMVNALAANATGDYKALVCLFFGGGIDSYNVLVPTSDPHYGDYAAVRRDLALPQASLLPINPLTSDGRQYGLHPNMAELQTLFENGDAAMLSNVGTLVEPMTMAQWQNGSARRPLGLFSHSDQAMQWQTSIPDRRNASGWAGRMADLLGGLNSNPNIAMNISLGGNNTFQSGDVTAHYTITQNGSRGLRGYQGTSAFDQVKTEAVDNLLAMNYQHLFERLFATRMRGAIDAHLEFSAAIDALAPMQTIFSATNLSQNFRMIAQTIAARQALGMCRQTFFVDMGGWDHHDEVLLSQEAMLPVVSAALSEFNSAMIELGVHDDVTTFTSSDFGRTLTSNGRGSDHAWGGNHIVMGGAVNGQERYGTYPDMGSGSMLDIGRGRLIPTTSVDEYFAELALWFGVPRQDLELVLPNVRRFYDPSSASPPIGMLLPQAGSSSNGVTIPRPTTTPNRPQSRKRQPRRAS